MNSLDIWRQNNTIVFGEGSYFEDYAPEIATQKIYVNVALSLNQEAWEAGEGQRKGARAFRRSGQRP